MKKYPGTFPQQPTIVQSQPTPPTHSSFVRNLTLGMTGEDVRSLQQFLNTHGFTVSSTGAGSPGQETAYFGPATQRALIRYQVAHTITPALGYFGPLTRTSLSGANATNTESTTSTSTNVHLPLSLTFTTGLQLGLTSPDILQLQQLLNTDPDTQVAQSGVGSPGKETAYFGILTLEAVKRFHIKYDIAQKGDPGFGYVGPQTREKLNELAGSL